MNKTVNINLANTFFHIDEEAYKKLNRYLQSIQRSFAGTPGSDEIIADIEARIAELFRDKMSSDLQVITQKEVDEIITIMGQPEDYMVDEDIFDDAPKNESAPTPSESTKGKKLYRDIDHKYIGGVCAGLEHYMGLDALWIRLIFLALGIFTGFGFIAYILLWILVPEAATTAQKLDMTGEPVNISNIEKKVKEGFDNVASKVKNVDYDKMGQRVKNSGQTFFDTVGSVIMFLLKVLAKFIGLILICVGAAALIFLFIGLFAFGFFDALHIPGLDVYDLVNLGNVPRWGMALLCFFSIGIPFFFLLYLGLKIMVSNLKSIGNIAKYTLLGLWLLSISMLVALGIRQAASRAHTGSVSTTENLQFAQEPDTLKVVMRASDLYENQTDFGFEGFTIAYDEADRKLLFADDVDLDIRKSDDDQIKLKVWKKSRGSSFNDARDRAQEIVYHYSTEGNTIVLDNFLTTAYENHISGQEVNVVLYLPTGTKLSLDQSTDWHIGGDTHNNMDYYRGQMVDHVWTMGKTELECDDCEESEPEDSGHKNKINIDENGVDIDLKDEDGSSFQMKIDQNGMNIKADDANN